MSITEKQIHETMPECRKSGAKSKGELAAVPLFFPLLSSGDLRYDVHSIVSFEDTQQLICNIISPKFCLWQRYKNIGRGLGPYFDISKQI